jgi:hypothetical protein
MEYDFLISPESDPSQIEMDFSGATALKLTKAGELVVGADGSEFLHRRPVVYQVHAGIREEVAGAFVFRGENRVAFQLGSYDHAQELVIDPVLSYSALMGGSGTEVANAVAVDTAGNAYVTGQTTSFDFPFVAGSLRTTFNGGAAFVYKLSPSGTTMLYSAMISGVSGNAIAVDASGNAYIAGGSSGDVFVFKLNNTGSAILYSMTFGGSFPDSANGIAVDASGDAFVTGSTSSADFPTTPGAFQTSTSSASTCFVAKVNPTGTALIYSTFLGGTGAHFTGETANAIAIDSSRNAYVAGSTTSSDFPVVAGSFQTDGSEVGLGAGFVTKLNPSGSALIYSTFLPGGSVSANGIAIDLGGNAFVAGSSNYLSLPLVPAPSGMFVLKLNPAGTALGYLSLIGPEQGAANAIAIDLAGNAYVTGWTSSSSFPVIAPIQAIPGLADNQTKNAVLVALDVAGATTFSSYLGGQNNGDTGYGIAISSAGTAYIVGRAGSLQFPITPGAAGKTSGDGFDTFITAVNLSSGCTFSLSPSNSFPSSGGSGTVDVATQSLCDWIAISNQPWIAITGGSSGSGPGTVNYKVASSTVPSRSAPLSIGGVLTTISQAVGCTYSLSSTSSMVPAAGMLVTVSLSTGFGCTYTASTPPAWILQYAGQPYDGSTQFVFNVTANTGSGPRSATLTLAGQPFVINQNGGYTCTFVLGPNGSYPAGGQPSFVQVTTSSTCSWSAVSNAAWLHVDLVASGSGNDPQFGIGSGHVNFHVDTNFGSSRVGTLTIGGATFTVTQAASTASLPTATLRDASGAIRLASYGSSTLSSSGGAFASDPSSAQDPTGNTFVTARDNFNAIWANVYNQGNATWSGWQFGGGAIQGVPSIAVDRVGTGWIASRDNYDSYWLLSYTPRTGFGTWVHLDGVFSTDPVITACGDGSLYLAGKDNFNALWSGRYMPGTGFQGFQLGGGVVQGKPSLSCGGDNAAYISARDNFNSNWVARVSGNTWTGWFNGGAVTSIDPRIAALGGTLAVVILDGTGAVYQTTFAQVSGNGWQPWIGVGGVLSDVAPAAVSGVLFFAGRAPNGDLWWWQQTGDQWTWIGNNGVAAGALSAAPR